MEGAAGLIAPIATAIAAMMTAANLGARVTGWGFVVFTIGSIGWCTVGLSTGQTNLLLTNGFLTLVNILGIWRWLGREARYEKEADVAIEESLEQGEAALLALTSLTGMAVALSDGEKIGSSVEVMLDCAAGRIDYVVVSSGGVGGVGERLTAIEWNALELSRDHIRLDLTRTAFDALPEWKPTRALAGTPAPG